MRQSSCKILFYKNFFKYTRNYKRWKECSPLYPFLQSILWNWVEQIFFAHRMNIFLRRCMVLGLTKECVVSIDPQKWFTEQKWCCVFDFRTVRILCPIFRPGNTSLSLSVSRFLWVITLAHMRQYPARSRNHNTARSCPMEDYKWQWLLA